MRMTLLVCLVYCLMLVACSSGAAASADPTRGAALFSGQTPMPNDAPACSSCHLVDPGSGALVGPNLSNIGAIAATRVSGQSAEAYLRASLLDPDSYLVEGFQEGIMYKGYGQDLSPQQIDDLVAYLLTLKSE